MDCFALLAKTLHFSVRHCEEGEDRRGNPWVAIRVCYNAVPLAASGLLRAARKDVEFSRHCEEGEDRRGNPELATGVCFAAAPLPASGLLPAAGSPPRLKVFALEMTLNFVRHCEVGEDRRGNPESATGVSSAAVSVAAHMDCFALLAMTWFFRLSCAESKRPAVSGVEPACRERSRTAILNPWHFKPLAFDIPPDSGFHVSCRCQPFGLKSVHFFGDPGWVGVCP